jgi:hypothetical protein
MATTDDATTGAPPPPQAPGGSLLQTLTGVLQELPGLVSDRVRLLALELQRAGLALAQMAALVVAAAILASTAWLALWSGIAVAMVRAGTPWGWALAIVIVVNFSAAALALRRARGLARWLGLPATLRRLTQAPPAGPQGPAVAGSREATGPRRPVNAV